MRVIGIACAIGDYLAAAWYITVGVRLAYHFNRLPSPRLATWIRYELDYLVPVAITLNALFDPHGRPQHHWWTALMIAWQMFCWWLLRRGDRDDDDRWKRRGRRLRERVAAVRGRLVVQPT